MYLKNQNQIRQIQWLTTDQWDIKIEEAPVPFNDWFPATDITVNELSSEHHNIQTPSADYDIPKRGGRETITITALDDQFRTLQNWYDDLNTRIYASPWGVLPLEKSMVRINVVQTDVKKNTIKHLMYYCIPDGSVSWVGESTKNISTLNLTFKIVNRKIISQRPANSNNSRN